MTVPASGTIKLSDIKFEFGGASPPANLRAYRDGAGYMTRSPPKPDYVPSYPSSGANLAIRDFMGAKKNPLSVSLNTTSASGSRPCPPSGPAPTGWVTATVTGGSGNYTYAWTEVSAVPEGITMTASTSASTKFTKWVSEDESYYGEFVCTITDNEHPYHFQITTDVVVVVCSAGAATAMSASVSPTSASAWSYVSGAAVTGTVTPSASGGGGSYTYSWAKVSGTTLSLSSTTGATTFGYDFSGSGSVSATYEVTATDQWGATATAQVSISLVCYASLSCSADYSTRSGTVQVPGTATSNTVTASASGGSGGYSYSWAKLSGSPAFTINSPSSAATTFSQYYGTGAWGASDVEVFRCTVTDSQGRTNTADVTVTITSSAPALGVSISPSYVEGRGSGSRSQYVVSADATASSSNGTAPFTYSWAKVSGVTMTVLDAAGSATGFRAFMTAHATNTAVYRCTMTDVNGWTGYADVSVALINYFVLTLSCEPAYVDGFGGGETETTVESGQMYALPGDGRDPYTVTLERLSGSTMSVNHGASYFDPYSFSASLNPGNTATAVYRFTVTDVDSNTATADVEIYLDNT